MEKKPEFNTGKKILDVWFESETGQGGWVGCSTHKGAGVESDTLGSIAVVQIRNPGLGHGASSEEESTNSMCILVDVANSLWGMKGNFQSWFEYSSGQVHKGVIYWVQGWKDNATEKNQVTFTRHDLQPNFLIQSHIFLAPYLFENNSSFT